MVTAGVLLDPASDLVDDLCGELDGVDGVQDRAGVVELETCCQMCDEKEEPATILGAISA